MGIYVHSRNNRRDKISFMFLATIIHYETKKEKKGIVEEIFHQKLDDEFSHTKARL